MTLFNYARCGTAVACLLLASACTTTGAPFTPVPLADDGKSVIYLYHRCNPAGDRYATGGTIGPEIRVNDKFMGYLAPDSYMPLVVPKGGLQLAVLPTWNYDFIPKLEFTYQIDEPKERFLKFELKMEGVSYSVARVESLVEEIEAGQGRNEIRDCGLNAAALERARARRAAQQNPDEPA